MKTIGKYYDHKSQHFKFPRTIDGFKPDDESGRGDKVVFVVAVIIFILIIIFAIKG